MASADAAPPDAIVLDIGMPGMDGCAVARRLRHDPHTAGETLVALNGWGQSIDRQRARDSGFDHHPTEPADLESLLAILAPAPAPDPDQPMGLLSFPNNGLQTCVPVTIREANHTS